MEEEEGLWREPSRTWFISQWRDQINEIRTVRSMLQMFLLTFHIFFSILLFFFFFSSSEISDVMMMRQTFANDDTFLFASSVRPQKKIQNINKTKKKSFSFSLVLFFLLAPLPVSLDPSTSSSYDSSADSLRVSSIHWARAHNQTRWGKKKE